MATAAPNETIEIMPADTARRIEENKPKTVKMELKRNYVPLQQPPRIVGWNRPEIRTKDAGGREIIRQEAGFVAGEMAPAPSPGVGYPNKVWAGTVIEVPEDEARTMRANKIAEAWL